MCVIETSFDYLETVMGILVWIVFGLIAGSFARLVMPGPSAGGLAVALGLGVGGAVVGGLIGTLVGGPLTGFDFRSFLMAIIGSLAVLFSYRSHAIRGMA
jgi:uncharacterized membrane protein YeaQ/YmgE (transglycosylase-associated protein family)